MEGRIFGRYRVTRKIGAGGMGEVYAASHELMQREAAIKILLPEYSNQQTVVKRFFQEAQAAARVQHPGIVEVFDYGHTDDGRAYIVMEMLRGQTLNERLAHTPVLPLEQSLRLVRQLAGAMGAAHEQGIVHRDLKPDNIFIVSDPEVQGGERVKVLDFGLAKLAIPLDGTQVTLDGSVFGTPAYMSPEQCANAAAVDHRADLYSIGCIFYRCLCGRAPFGSGGGVEMLASHLYAAVPRPSRWQPGIPSSIEDVILTLLKKDPAERFPSCQVLVDVLDGKRLHHSMATAAVAGRGATSLPAGSSEGQTMNVRGSKRRRLPLPGVSPVQPMDDGRDTERVQAPADLHAATTMQLAPPQLIATMMGNGVRAPSVTPARAARPVMAARPARPAAAPAGDNVTMLFDGPIEEIHAIGQAGELAGAARGWEPVPPMLGHGTAPGYGTAPGHGDPGHGSPDYGGPGYNGNAYDNRPARRSSVSMAGVGEIYASPGAGGFGGRLGLGRRQWLAVAGAAAAAAGILVAALMIFLDQEREPGKQDRNAAAEQERSIEDRIRALDEQLDKATKAAAAHEWQKVLSIPEPSMEGMPANDALLERIERVTALRQQAEQELAGQGALARFHRAVEAFPQDMAALDEDQLDAALARYQEIPGSSHARGQAMDAYHALRDRWREHVDREARALSKRGACDEITASLEQAAARFPDAGDGYWQPIAKEAEACAARVERKRARARAASEASEAKEAEAAKTTGPARQKAIENAYKQGKYRSVVDLCNAGIGSVPRKEQAALRCVMAACRSKRASTARYYYGKLSEPKQSQVLQFCRNQSLDPRSSR